MNPRRFLLTLLVLCTSLLAACSPALPPSITSGYPGEDEAVVRKVVAEGAKPIPQNRSVTPYQTLSVELMTGRASGQVVDAEAEFGAVAQTRFRAGDRVLVQQVGAADGSGLRWVVVDAVRLPTLYLLAAAFVALVLWVGRGRGVTSILGLVVSFAVVLFGVLPLLVSGADPLLVSTGASCVILVTTLYLAHGFNRRTSVAAAATALVLVGGGLLSLLAVDIAKLGGGATEESVYLQSVLPGVRLDLRGMLQAGILIALLGILDDVTIGQAAVVFTLRSVNPALRASQLYGKAMEVGREHIASLVNTLVLAYTGVSLPLLLLLTASDIPIAAALNREVVATEVVRTLVGSIALVAAVPVTTFLAAQVAVRSPAGPAPGPDAGGHVHLHTP